MKTTLSSMFIEFDIRQGEKELQAQEVTRDRAEARNFGTRASAIHRAGRTVWRTDGQKDTRLHVVANRRQTHVG